jgi:hypothetical protein
MLGTKKNVHIQPHDNKYCTDIWQLCWWYSPEHYVVYGHGLYSLGHRQFDEVFGEAVTVLETRGFSNRNEAVRPAELE